MKIECTEGNRVLLITPISPPATLEEQIKQQIGENGSLHFVRHCNLSSTGFSDNSFDWIIVIGSAIDHTKSFFQKVSSLLKSGGKFSITEPTANENEAKDNLRTNSTIESELIISGLINIQSNLLEKNTVSSVHQFVGQKPNYATGAAQLLRTRKPVVENAEAAKPKATTWTIDEDDALEDIPIVSAPTNNTWKINNDDDDVIDEDLLLDEIDRQVVSVLPVSDDCENSATAGKRGACKNCTCGRADMKEEEIESTKSSCGNCYLGDAFRCSTCPYLGQPAFKPGERVTLSLN